MKTNDLIILPEKPQRPYAMKYKFIMTLMVITYSHVAFAQSRENLNLEGDLAAQGYDVVAYFQGEPQKGVMDFSSLHEGVEYRFATAKNKDLFTENPARYIPQYGGWCAYAMGYTGTKVSVNPETFKIIDNKLYLFYNAYFNNTLKKWNKNEKQLKPLADQNWSKIIESYEN